MAPEKQAAYAFVAVRDRMYPGYIHRSDKIDYGTIAYLDLRRSQ